MPARVSVMAASEAAFPARYRRREQVRHLFGDMADRYASFYLRSDPSADALADWMVREGEEAKRSFELALRAGAGSVPAQSRELRAFMDAVEAVPSWVDFEQLDRGALAYQRFGLMGMIILSAWSLINGYHSSAAVKPLAFTGQLRHRTQRRLAETARFVSEVSQTDGLRARQTGFTICVRVRLVHAFVRRACWESGRWQSEAWGEPINQADMFGTLLEFSLLMMDGAMRLGFRVTPDEREAILALWRYCGYLSGVDEWLLSKMASERDTRHMSRLLRLVQPGPDEDSRALTAQLLHVPRLNAQGRGPALLAIAVSRFHNGLARALNGPEISDELGLPDDLWQHALHPVRAVLTPLELLREQIPGASLRASELGNRAVRSDLLRILRGVEPSFAPPV